MQVSFREAHDWENTTAITIATATTAISSNTTTARDCLVKPGHLRQSTII